MKRSSWCTFAAFLLASHTAIAQDLPPEERFELTVGQQVNLQTFQSSARSYTCTDEQIDIRDIGTLLVVGTRPGFASCMLFDVAMHPVRRIFFTIYPQNFQVYQQQLEALLRDEPHVRVLRLGFLYVVDGHVANETRRQRILQIVSIFNRQLQEEGP